MRGRKNLKWEFYAISAEEMIGYVDKDEVQESTIFHSISSSHIPIAIDNIISATRNCPKFEVFYMRGAVQRKITN